MDKISIVKKLENKGATLKVVDGELRIKADRSLMTPEIQNFIRENKSDIINYLLQRELKAEIPVAVQKENYALSAIQQRMYFLFEMQPDSLAYNIPQVIKLKGAVNRNKIENAIKGLIEHHEVLRTSFKKTDEGVFQEVHEEVSFNLENDTTKGISVEEMVSNFICPFNLAKAPLLRAGLKELADNEYLLLFDMHHIITDGVSYSILIRDFLKLYHGELLSKPSVRFIDYAEWQQSEQFLEKQQLQKDFWKNEMSGELPLLELPTVTSRPKVKTNKGASYSFELDASATLDLKRLARGKATTVFNALLAIYNILLHKLSNQNDIIVGTPTAGRNHADIQEVLGVFVNVVLLRNKPAAKLTFNQFLSQAHDNTINALENQDFQYEQIIEMLGVERDTSRNPLFDVAFSFENFEKTSFSIQGLELEPVETEHTVSKFDLTLIVKEADDKLQFTFEYATDLFNEGRIKAFASFFKLLVGEVINNPDCAISELNILTQTEKDRLLNTLNDTAVSYPAYNSLLELFDERVTEIPDEVAVVFDDKSLTFKELEQRSAEVASLLQSEGIGKEDMVPVCLDRSLEMIVGILGILRCGAAYVPIDPAYPAERIQFILEDISAGNVLTHSKNAEILEQFTEVNLIVLDKLGSNLSTKMKPVSVNPEDLAYVIYTSGTTGKPKGVMNEHGGILNRLLWKRDYLNINNSDVIFQKTTFCFDVSVWELLIPLITGAKMILALPDGHKDNLYLQKAIKDNQVSIMHFVPSMLSAFLLDADIESCKSLKHVVCSGEALQPSVVADFKAKLPEVKLHNLYGPTEAAIDVTAIEVTSTDKFRNEVPIGYPVSNTKIIIVNEQNKIQPAGVIGELLIGGIQVARGYVNREQLTSEKFITNPFDPEDPYKLYRTGDLACRLDDGTILYKGRIDHQVKLRGFRIELGEIESRVQEINGIGQNVVLLKEISGNKALVCYYLAENRISDKLLRENLNQVLPEYMVPSYFVWLKEFPLTSNGKLDRKSLPLPEANNTSLYKAPVTKEQKILADVWGAVLGNRKIGITDNFFGVGGDSIKSIQISSRMRNHGYDVTVKDIFSYPTIEQLSFNLRKLTRKIDQGPVVGSFGVSPIQNWFLNYGNTNKDHFNQSVLLAFKEPLKPAVLKNIFKVLVEHHDALRLCYKGKTQESLPVEEVNISIEEYGINNAEEIHELANSLQQALNLNESPLFRIGLFDEQNTKSYVLIAMHHWIVDAVSWRIILEDFAQLYDAFIHKKPQNLASKTDAYANWIEALSAYRQTNKFSDGLAYWKRRAVENNPWIVSEKDNLGNTVSDFENRSFTLGKEQTKLLLETSHDAYTTQINDLLLAALIVALNKEFGLNNVNVDLESHGREEQIGDINVSRTVGWFTTFHPVSLKYKSDYKDLIRGVKEAVREVPNSGIDYLLGIQTGDLNIAQAPIIFNYLGQFDNDKNTKPFSVSTAKRGEEVSVISDRTHDWEITGYVSERKLHLNVSFSKSKFETSKIGTFMESFQSEIEALLKHCNEMTEKVLSPSDLTIQGLEMKVLDILQSEYEIEDIYPLSPMQEGMLFYALMDPESDQYFEQMCFGIEGNLNIEAVEKSMDMLMQRYSILRTMFLYDKHHRPLQLVLKNRSVDFRYKDARKETANGENHDIVLKKYRDEDKNEKFDLAKDSLMRLTIVQINDTGYEFIWSFHHILMDGWCISILINEFNACYESLIAGKMITLPVVKPFIHYLKWLEGFNKNASEAYWKKYLEGYTSHASLPGKLTLNNAEKSFDTSALVIDGKLIDSINKLSHKHGVTFNTILQAAWGILLARYNAANDVVFGAVVSGRPPQLTGVENMVGLFINTIPVRVRFDDATRTDDFLKDLQKEALNSEEFHYQSLSEIQKLSTLDKELLDHILVFENYPVAEKVKNGNDEPEASLNITHAEIFERANYDLCLVVLPGQETVIEFQFSNRYQPTLIENVKNQLVFLLQQIVDNDAVSLCDIDLMTQDAAAKQIAEFNDTKVPYPSEKNVVTLFEEQLKRTPNKIALTENKTELTYSELNTRANAIANAIIEDGIAPGTSIGILAPRSAEAVIAWLGALKAGCVYVPLDPDYPVSRIHYMIEDADISMVLIHDAIELELPGSVTVNTISSFGATKKSVTRVNPSKPLDPAYIMYTSGSTGQPKGVVVCHKNIVRLIKNTNFTELNENTKVLQTGSPVFDATTFEIWGSLLNGGSLYVVPKNTLLNSDEFKKAITAYKINTMWLTAPLFDQHVQNDPTIFATIKYLLVGGDKLTPEFVNKALELNSGLEIINGYGPTENTTFSVCHNIKEKYRTSVPIGKPIHNSTAYIVDNRGKIQPPFIAGELWVGGDGVSLGYLNNEVLTKEKFIESPFKNNERIYKTGDMARWLPDGTLEFLGRIDKQIKIQGYRIEIEEIEFRLNKHPYIKQSAVVAVNYGNDKVLVAYYTADKDMALQEIKDFMLQELPDYMIPVSFMPLDSFPLNTNGKLDRDKLPQPEFGKQDKLEAAVGETQKKLVAIWAELLIIDESKIGINHSFFESGGNSLKVVTMISKIEKEFNVKIQMASFFKDPTIKNLHSMILMASLTGEIKNDAKKITI